MDSSSNNGENDKDSMESPQPHKKRKISSQKTKSIHYLTRSQSNNDALPLKNKKKRRFAGINSSRNNKNKNKNKSCLPWWIGQRIIVQIPAPKTNQNKKTKAKIKTKSNFRTIGRKATIRDYDPNTQLSHIWYETEDNHCENVDLFELEEWDIANARPVHQQMEFVPDNEWIPFYWKMKQRVLVKFDGTYGNGSQFCAFVDGYDPISRRHHINYGDTTEWLWATKKRVEIYQGKCYGYIEEKLKKFKKNKDEVEPPPWDPVPYGLDETFEIRSKEIETNRNNSVKKQNNSNIVSSRKKNHIKPQRALRNDQQKSSNSNVVAAQNNAIIPQREWRNDQQNKNASVKIFGNKTHPRRKLHDAAVTNGNTQQKKSLMRKKSSTLDKLLKSTSSKKNSTTTTQRHLKRHLNASTAQNKEKKECDAILDKNNESVTSISCSSSSSSESTFDAKTCQKMSDSDKDIISSSKATTNTTTKHTNHCETKTKTINNAKSDISNKPIQVNNQKSQKINMTSKKQRRKKKISLRLSKKSITKTTNTNPKSFSKKTKVCNNSANTTTTTNDKQQTQTQTMPVHKIPISNNSINQHPIIVNQIPTTSNQLQAMSQIPIPIRSVIPIPTTLQLFMPHVVTNNLTISQPKHPPIPLIQKKKKKYPRKAIIDGETWIRHYSRNDRKYYWLLHNDKNVIIGKEWDPWRKNGEKAPWMVCMQKWGKFTDPTEKKEYYYNYETRESTFKRPKGFEADEQIQYDSADDHSPKW